MTSKRNWSVLIVLSFLLALSLLGCVRPMPGEDGALVATSPPAADSDSYPAPAEPQSEAQVQESYPSEEGYPVEQGQGDQAELMQPESAEGASEAYPAPESAAAAEEAGESYPSTAEEQTTAEGSTPDQTPEDETAAEQSAEDATPQAESAEGQITEGETVEEATGGDQSAQAETAESESVESGRTHTVASGETLFSIGMQYGMSWVTLAQANNITNPDSLYIGQVLIIPDVETLEETESAATADTEAAAAEDAAAEAGEGEPAQAEESADAAATAEQTTYIVQSGDTLLSISYRFGVTIMDIARENELVSFDQIYAGQELVIPTAEGEAAPDQDAGSAADSAETSTTTHVVAEGETVFTIAFQYGVTWTELVEANDIASPYTLEAGQTLIIPASE